MKLKPVVNGGKRWKALRQKLNSIEFRDFVFDEVLERHLHVTNIGPATHYAQKCDIAVGDEPMLEVSLSRVSVATNRSTDDFYAARDALEWIYASEFKAHLKPGERGQLMATVILDRAPLDRNSSLIEGPGGGAICIVGE